MDKILQKLQPIIPIFKRYGVIIFIMSVSLVYGYIIITSSKLVDVSPSISEVDKNYQGAKRPDIDKKTVDKLYELVDRNVPLQSIIDEARRNPFQE